MFDQLVPHHHRSAICGAEASRDRLRIVVSLYYPIRQAIEPTPNVVRGRTDDAYVNKWLRQQELQCFGAVSSPRPPSAGAPVSKCTALYRTVHIAMNQADSYDPTTDDKPRSPNRHKPCLSACSVSRTR